MFRRSVLTLAVLGLLFSLGSGGTKAAPPASTTKAASSPAPSSQPQTGKAFWFKKTRPPDKEEVYKKCPQAKPPSQTELKLFIYLPSDWKKTDKRPAIVFFHGGGWQRGDPEAFYAKAEYFASRGMVGFCADYRGMTERDNTTAASCVEDARSAIRYVRSHAADWGVDGNKLISAGGSAGGHLAAALATLDGPDDPNDDLKVSCVPQAMVLFNPVMKLGWSPYESKMVHGDTDEEKKAALKKLSPIEYLKKGCPPMIMFYGTGDGYLKGAREFAGKGIALGSRIEIWSAPGIDHGFFNYPPWHQTTLIIADEFLASLGYLKGPPTIKSGNPAAVLTKEALEPTTQPAAPK